MKFEDVNDYFVQTIKKFDSDFAEIQSVNFEIEFIDKHDYKHLEKRTFKISELN